MIKLTVKIPKIKRFKLKPREIDQAAQILIDDLKQTVPYESGKLYNSISKRKTANGVDFYIKGKRNNEIAGYLIKGTDDHFVRPKGSTMYTKTGRLLKSPSTRKIKSGDKHKRVLAWQDSVGGETHFSAGHFVKGIKKGYWKFQPRPQAMQEFARQLNTAIKSR